ncbi:urease accessory protein [Streptomyces microflavus]|uniref:urease accessory protein n=1 Tax=Streptomyces microflavus TaxID=1919 RepID=UPI0036EC2CEB
MILDQGADYGPGAAGWDSPAVLAHHRAAGPILVVETGFAPAPPTFQALTEISQDGLAVLTPLAGPAALVTAIASDGLRLRHLLNITHSTYLSR